MKLRFQFGLRTLLVAVTLVAVACCFVQHEYSIVRARQNYLHTHGQHLSNLSGMNTTFREGEIEMAPSVLRQWLGDKPIRILGVRRYATSDDVRDLIRLFPEADLYYEYSYSLSGELYDPPPLPPEDDWGKNHPAVVKRPGFSDWTRDSNATNH